MAKDKQIIKTVTRSEKDDRKYHFTAKVWGEVRTVTDVVMTIEGTEYHSLELGLDDEEGERFYLTDKDMSHAEIFKRGVTGTFEIRIDVEEGFMSHTTKTGKEMTQNGKYKILLTGFEADK